MAGNNILLQRLRQPRRVQLPNSCVFFAKYQRVGRHVLNATLVTINQTYVRKIDPRRQRIRRYGPQNKRRQRQRGGAGIDLSTAIDLEKKVAGLSVRQMTIKDAINALPTAYKKLKAK